MALSQVSLFNVKVICKPLSKIFVLTLFSELLALFAIYFAHGVLVRERIAGRFSLICESTRHLHVMNHITFTKQFLNWIWIKKTFVMVMLYSLTNLLWHIQYITSVIKNKFLYIIHLHYPKYSRVVNYWHFSRHVNWENSILSVSWGLCSCN